MSRISVARRSTESVEPTTDRVAALTYTTKAIPTRVLCRVLDYNSLLCSPKLKAVIG